MQMSRSVIVATTRPWESTTGRTPQSFSHNSLAAVSRESWGAHVRTGRVINSWFFMILVSLVGFPIEAPPDGCRHASMWVGLDQGFVGRVLEIGEHDGATRAEEVAEFLARGLGTWTRSPLASR